MCDLRPKNCIADAMKKTSISISFAIVVLTLSMGNAQAFKSSDLCLVPKNSASQMTVPFIKTPEKFLKASLKETHTIRNFKVIKSHDFEEAYFLAGDIVNKITNKSRGIGVWFAPDGYAMPGPAAQYSTFLPAKIGRTIWADSGNGYKIKKEVTKKSHGYKEVLSCYR